MDGINLEEDIRPLSEFRANTATLVRQVKKTGRPLVLTQHGKSAVVLLDVGHYQSMISSIESFRRFHEVAHRNMPGNDPRP
jgi:prevent-host-death family protein